MPALRLKATMTAIADALVEAGVVKKAWSRPHEVADKGEASVGYPRTVAFDKTFGRGADEAVIPLFILAGIVWDESTQDELDRLLGDGREAVKDALERGDHGGLDEVLQSLWVRSAAVEVLVMKGGIRWAAVRYDCEVTS